MNRTSKTFFSILLVVFFCIGISSCGKSERVESKSKTNSPPVITSVAITPNQPTKENDLGLIVQGHDPDQDTVAYRFQWVKNDDEMVGENNNMLRSGSFKKADMIQVKVTPSDGKTEGKPLLSAPVKILNSLPVIQEVRIEPRIAIARDDLKVSIESSDADRDFIYYIYKWEKNGAVLSEEGKGILERDRFKKGDRIAVTVIPDDRETIGTLKRSEAIVISNSPPVIISSPPTTTEGAKYLYQVKADDPDHDPITFILKSGPKGMEIDRNTGLIRWEIRKEDKGVYSVEVEGADNEGAKSNQQYQLTVEFK